MAEDERKTELIAELARSRSQIAGNWSGLRGDLDIVTHTRQSFSRHPAIWIGAAVLLGLFIARLPLGRKKAAPVPRKKAEPTVEKVEKAGLLLAGLKFAFNLARPALTAWVTRRTAEYFDERNRHGSTRR